MVNIRVALTAPDGTEYDVTDRVRRDSLSQWTEQGEEDLASLTHGDADLRLDDRDGWVEALFSGATPADTWRVTIDEETSPGAWERLFYGVLDLPYSLALDRRDRRATMQAWTASKLLERTSAENFRRNLSGRTGTVTAASRTVTCSSAASLVAGDTIRLTAGTTSEDQVIQSVDSATQVTTVAAYANTFFAAALTLETPYYRNTAAATLAADLIALAGLEVGTIDLISVLGADPFVGSINSAGISGTPSGVLETGGNLKVYSGGNRYSAPDLTTGFSSEGADTAKMDWRPYDATSTAPATLRAGTDDGSRATDPATGDYYELGFSGLQLVLKKNGATIATVELGASADFWAYYGLDWCPQLSEIWVGYGRHNYGPPIDPEYISTTQKTKRYDSSGALLGTLPGGLPRSVRVRGQMALRTFTVEVGIEPYLVDASLDLYDVSSSPVLSVSLPPAEEPIIWTLRALGANHLCAICQPASGKTTIAVWRDTAGTLIAEHAVADVQSPTNIATVFDEGGTATPTYVARAGGTWCGVSTAFTGVVPYFDCEGKSCATALRELALFAAATFRVDEYGIVSVTKRTSAAIVGQEPVDVDSPITKWVERPISEWYRASVRVAGRTEADVEVSEIAGETGDDARRLTVDLEIPLTQSYASALAADYLAFAGATRREVDAVFYGLPFRPRYAQLLRVDATVWRVIEASYNQPARQHSVRLIEEV